MAQSRRSVDSTSPDYAAPGETVIRLDDRHHRLGATVETVPIICVIPGSFRHDRG